MKCIWVWTSFLLQGMISISFAAAAEENRTSFRFRTPHFENYHIEATALRSANPPERVEWLRAQRDDGSTNAVEFGSRLVIQLDSPDSLAGIIDEHALTLARQIGSNVFILQAPDARIAMRTAHELAERPGVRASYPIMRRQNLLHTPYAPPPTDSMYLAEWQLEHRLNGYPAGPDLNVRAAWPLTKGAGITVAVVDTGIEMNHPELQAAVAGSPHYNFFSDTTNGTPLNRSAIAAHGTEVSGLIAAGLNNARIVGAAPASKLASWVIFSTNGFLTSDDNLLDMYQYQPTTVSIQNHSWGGGNGAVSQVGPTFLERIGIESAVSFGRLGLGIVMFRSAGNDRSLNARADDDGYPATPQVVAVAAINVNGRAASFSEPGACVLVSAPSGDAESAAPGLFTTDLLGTDGANAFSFFPPDEDLSGYVFHNQFIPQLTGFAGTSASAPLISSVAALMLSANTNLGYRDVQQILVLASRHFDFLDADLKTNGAGFLVSHNAGYGVPDAGQAVWLSRLWSNRPPFTTVSLMDTQSLPVPDDALRVEVSGPGTPPALTSIRCLPSLGPFADAPTPQLPLVDIGLASNVPPIDLTNKGALILRGGNDFSVKINNAAQAGAAFAVVYNYSTNVSPLGGDQLTAMGKTDFVRIPAVFIGNTDGEALKAFFQTNTLATARIHVQSAEKFFTVATPMICEHVGVRIQSNQPRRSDWRITLVSPSGTRSVLQAYNLDTTAGPADWTYWSTHHFFEGSAGNWQVAISDQVAGATGSVTGVTLIIRGTPIVDTDQDGLDDTWETTRLSSLEFGPKDDPDGDGFSNAREQVMQTNPMGVDFPLVLNLSWWELTGTKLARLTFPGSPQYNYQIFTGNNPAALTLLTNIPGTFPETEWLGPYDPSPGSQFYKVFSTPAP